MNKKLAIIIGLIVIIIVAIGIYIIGKKDNLNEPEPETGSFNNMSITVKGYTININSAETGHSSENSYFQTSFNIIDSDNNKRTYNVDFVKLYLSSDEISTEDMIDDIAKPEIITINGKTFEYYLDEYNHNATLYYQIPDKNGQLMIKVSGRDIFDHEGNQLKTLAPIDKEILESSQLAGILNFSVTKSTK